MKKGRRILLLIFALGLSMVVGVFLGRNHRGHYAQLPINTNTESSQHQISVEELKLDINSASLTQLMDLPGIGPTLADRIIVYRERNGAFQSVEDLLLIEGIGPKKLSQIETLITVGG